MNGRNIASVAAASLVSSLLLASTSSGAQPSQSEVVIEKHIAPMTRYVSFADLSLATKEGQKVLYHRVGDAVQQVCPDFDDDGFGYDTQGCRDFAWDGARPQMRRAVNAAKAGFPLAMIVAISAAAK